MHAWEGRRWNPPGPGGHGEPGAGPAWGGRRRMRRGAVRRAVLWALAEGPGHGYEVMRRLEARSGGMWRPSPGSVYPTLQMLEDEGLVRSQADDATRTYELTDAGREAVSAPNWSVATDMDADMGQLRALHEAVGDTRAALRRIVESGRPHQVERATEIVQQARRDLYQLLAEG